MRGFASTSWRQATVGVRRIWRVLLLWALWPLAAAHAQTSFSAALDLGDGDWGAVTGNNSGVVPDVGAPNIAGFPPNHPLWYKWTAPRDGDVELDTAGSALVVTNIAVVGYDTNLQQVIYATNLVPVTQLDTVLGVYQGSDVRYLTQLAANDDLFPVNTRFSENLRTPDSDLLSSLSILTLPYHGPSHLRFSARAGQTYYFAVDTKAGAGNISLNWAYKSSGVFRFATEDVDPVTQQIEYQTSRTESQTPQGTAADVNSVVTTYYPYNAPGVLVTVTRTAGSRGRVSVDYHTVDGSGLRVGASVPAYAFYTNIVVYVTTNFTPSLDQNTAGATNDHTLTYVATTNSAGQYAVTNIFIGDYSPVSGTLVFDDGEMSKTILIPINPTGGYLSNPSITTNLVVSRNPFRTVTLNQQTVNNLSNAVFGVVLTNAQLDPLEAADVSAPRVDPFFSVAEIKILNTDADPYGPDWVPELVLTNIQYAVDTNGIITATNYLYATNMVAALAPTNVIFNFEKANYRVPADVNDSAIEPYFWPTVTLYVERFGTNTASETVYYRVDSTLNYNQGIHQFNNYFPLQPGSDYAVPSSTNQNSGIRNYPLNVYDGVSRNYDFDVADGSVSFPSTGGPEVFYQPIHITIPVSRATKFNKDFRISLYRMVQVGGNSVPHITGMNAEATVTILFNDENPPAGSVDEFFNADFNTEMATLPSRIPPTTPGNNSNPGVGSPVFPGQVYAIGVWTNDEALIGGDFPTYNGVARSGVALVQTNGQLDTTFDPGSGVSGDISGQGNDARVNAVAVAGNQFYLGGNFTAYNNTPANGVVRVNSDGSRDTTFNTAAGADGAVRALLVQPDGKVLIGGDFTHFNGVPRNYIARLNSDGSLDTSFDPSNILTGPVYSLAEAPTVVFSLDRNASGGPEEDIQPLNLGPLTSATLTVNYDFYSIPDEMRIFYGDTNTPAGTGVLIYDSGMTNGAGQIIVPFGPVNNVNGTLLTTNLLTIVMNQGGSTNSGTAWTYRATISVSQPVKGIMVGGNFNVRGQVYANIARLNSDGTLDPTFNPGTGPNGIVHALGWQLNDQIVAGGEFNSVNGLSYNHLVRFNRDGSIDTTNFFVGSGADDVVYSLTLDQIPGAIYVGGAFNSINGTLRRGFARLYSNGTVDTTFLDTAYNQFAGLKKIYSWDSPAVFASALQANGGVLIGGSFLQVGGGQANADVANFLDSQLFYPPSFGDANLWVEPKTRDGFRNRTGFARLIGGSTPGPGNIGLNQNSYSQDKSLSTLTVALVRTNGTLGAASANFIVQPQLAQPGRDYSYQAAPPLYWIGWDYLNLLTRMREDGLWGVSGNALLLDVFGTSLSQADTAVNNLARTTVNIINNPANPGNLNAQFQMANPNPDAFYLGGEEIPLGVALGVSSAPFILIDDTSSPGQFGFSSPTYVAVSNLVSITLVRSNGTFGVVSMRAWATNGTAVAGTDYRGLTNQLVVFNTGVTATNFTVQILNNGYITNVEKTVNLRLSNLGTTPGATFGISNAVLRIINPNFQGYVTLAATNFSSTTSAGVMKVTVNRVAGSLGAVSVNYATADGTALSNVDYVASSGTLTWNGGDVSPQTISIPLLPTQAVGGSNFFRIRLFTNGLASTPALIGVISNATCTISNDNSYGALQFSIASYLVNEATNNYALLTVLRTGGITGTDTVQFATGDASAHASVNYVPTNGVLTFLPGQTARSFRVYVLDDGVVDPPPANFYFNVALSNPTNGVLAAPAVAQVHLLDAESYNQPPGSGDATFLSDGMDGDVLALAQNSLGQIVAGGNFTAVGPTARSRIARLNPDGSLDTTFLNNMAGANAAVNAVVAQTALLGADRLLVAGAFTTLDDYTRYFVARLMTDGSVDSSFNPGAGADNVVDALAEAFAPAGTNLVRKIYVGGAFGAFNNHTSPGIERLNDDGSVDLTFNAGSGADGAVYAIAVYPTNSIYWGKVLIGGAFNHFNGVAVTNLARLNADGSLDTAFQANLGGGPGDAVRALAIELDGSILVGGAFTNFNGTPVNYLAHLNADGTLDTNFVANAAGGANAAVDVLALQPDQRILVGGNFTTFNGVTRNHITRLLPNGATDPTINFGLGANGVVDTILVQPTDGKIVLGGAFTQFDTQTANHIARIYGGSVTGSGAFEFTTAKFQVHEKALFAPITIRRNGGTSGPNSDGSGNVSVHFSTSDDTAFAGTNYFAVSTNVSFPPGEILETIYVPVLDDGIITPDLTVNLDLSNPSSPATLGAQPTAALTIINDDNAVSFSSTFYTVAKNEPTGMAKIDLLRQGGTNSLATVDFATTTNGATAVPGTDYYPTNETVVFSPGVADVTVQVPIINNNLPEGNRTIGLLLTNFVNTMAASPSNATLTIIDTVSAPGQLFFSATNFTANSADGYGYLTVLRTNGSSGSVSATFTLVPGTALPGVDYVNNSPGTVTFGNGDTAESIAVPLINNSQVRGTVSLSVLLSNPTGGATLTASTNALLTIVNTNIGFAFLNATNYVRETNAPVPIFVQRLGGPAGGVSVSFATTNNGTAVPGVNYTPVAGTLTFGSNETVKAIALPLLHDPRVTGDLTLGLQLFNPSIGTRLVAPSNSLVVIRDADVGLSFTNSQLTVLKSDARAVIVVTNSDPSLEPVIVDSNTIPLSVGYSTVDGTARAGVDYQAVSGTLFFTNGIGTNIFYVPIINNSLVNGNHSFSVTLFNPTPTNLAQVVYPSNLTVTIVDANSGLSFSQPTYSMLKTGVEKTITVVRTDNTNQVSSANFATADGTALAGQDYYPTNGLLIFTNGVTSQSFTVRVIANSTVQPDKTVLLQLFNPTNAFLIAPYAATLTIHDNSGSLIVPDGSMLVHESLKTNGIIDPGETVDVLFALRASGGTNVPVVYATLLATNGITAPSPSGPVSYGELDVGGPPAARQFEFTADPTYTNSQTIAATLLLNNGTTNIGTAVFTYTLGMWTNTFANTNLIIINDYGMATPYPSSITVTNLGGTLIKSVVTLSNLYHSFPRDVSVLLVSPAGQDTLLMSHTGGRTNAIRVTLTFDDAATNALPLNNALTTGTNRPTQYLTTPTFP